MGDMIIRSLALLGGGHLEHLDAALSVSHIDVACVVYSHIVGRLAGL